MHAYEMVSTPNIVLSRKFGKVLRIFGSAAYSVLQCSTSSYWYCITSSLRYKLYQISKLFVT